ncbi:MAG: carboxyl-terminal processing protease [Candidatus Atribacteria bacterium]|jgi:carboxyl-terminal processing protease|uniref:S41 family peptidase n=1 Tax=Atrimonas thermophila TaxID=3064161 RepID=UPI0024ABED43|nr:carboxyl-terminal processing protease [Candidatus Atribacteria bacterium]
MKLSKRFWTILVLILAVGLMVSLTLVRIWAISLGEESLDAGTWKPFLETVQLLKERFFFSERLEEQKLMEEAIRGLLRATQDPYARYLDAEDFKIEMSDQVEGQFSGLGILVAIKDGKLTVISPYVDSPAYAAGVRAGDVILEIDGEPTAGMALGDAVKKLRGPRGTQVTLTIEREGEPEPLHITVTRDVIVIKSVEVEKLDDQIAVLRIFEFHGKTFEQVRKALSELNHDGIQGLIVDLRNNPGGLLQTAMFTTGLFLPQDAPLLIVESREGSRHTLKNPINPEWDRPTVVLINKGTASGAEIMAGNLKNAGILLVGEQSFGKGVIQEIFPLSNGGGVIFTVSKYYLGDGSDIDGKGIAPQIEEKDEKLQLERALNEVKKLVGEPVEVLE